jgi:hypothetical protein
VDFHDDPIENHPPLSAQNNTIPQSHTTNIKQQQNITSLQTREKQTIKMTGKRFGPPVVMGDESIMSPKAHGTSAVYVKTLMIDDVQNPFL